MSYALNVDPDARAAVARLEFEVQEAVFDLLDELTKEGPELSAGPIRHVCVVSTPTTFTFVALRLVVDHGSRELGLLRVTAVVV